MKDSKIYSKIDLKSGYYQVMLEPKSRRYAALCIENNVYENIRMLFGLTGALKTFQEAMDALFSEFTFVKVYLDDIIIYSNDVETHLENLTTVLKKLNDNNIKINTDKWSLSRKKCSF
ncbi:Transposon Ty3-G Gag-Pol polyprotein [Dictyocoela muelleri]|nr:Transposon Ty3-G Gag-Pol polyprotein [Dictyocoela muelleri]